MEQQEQQAQDEEDAETEVGLQEIFALGLAPAVQAAEIHYFMPTRFNQRSRAQSQP